MLSIRLRHILCLFMIFKCNHPQFDFYAKRFQKPHDSDSFKWADWKNKSFAIRTSLLSLFFFFCSERCKCVLHKNTEYFSLSMNRGGLIRTLCINNSAGVFIFIHLSKDALLCILTQEGRSPLLLNDLDDMYSCSSLSNCIADLSLASFASRECFHPA